MSESKQCIKEGRCYHCGRKLTKRVQLDLNSATGQWSCIGWDERDSQGWFDFGPDCAAKLDVDAEHLDYKHRAYTAPAGRRLRRET